MAAFMVLDEHYNHRVMHGPEQWRTYIRYDVDRMGVPQEQQLLSARLHNWVSSAVLHAQQYVTTPTTRLSLHRIVE